MEIVIDKHIDKEIDRGEGEGGDLDEARTEEQALAVTEQPPKHRTTSPPSRPYRRHRASAEGARPAVSRRPVRHLPVRDRARSATAIAAAAAVGTATGDH